MSLVNPIAGGMFGRETLPGKGNQPAQPFSNGRHLKLFNARSSLLILCNLLGPERVWLPAYICHHMLDAVQHLAKIDFYPVARDLSSTNIQWIDNIKKGDLVVFVDYFGFDLHAKTMSLAKAAGAWTLQDAAQALLSTFERPNADFVLYSPRKFAGVPDGGILEAKCEVDLESCELSAAPQEMENLSETAFRKRTLFDLGKNTDWFSDYKAAEKSNCSGYYRMSTHAATLLDDIQYNSIANKRRKNYAILQDALSDVSLLGPLRPDITPLGFPVILEQRDQIQRELCEQNIFCPVHWNIAGVIPDNFKDAHYLSTHMLTLLCDQRVSDAQINRMIETVREAL